MQDSYAESMVSYPRIQKSEKNDNQFLEKNEINIPSFEQPALMALACFQFPDHIESSLDLNHWSQITEDIGKPSLPALESNLITHSLGN